LEKRTLEEDLQKIAVDINSQYVRAYVNETGFHRIQIQIPDANLRVRTRAGYFISASTASQTPNQIPDSK
jgi:hypothetical protein